MSETRIEYLMQAISAPTDRAIAGTARTRDNEDGFDNHLRDRELAVNRESRSLDSDARESTRRARSATRDQTAGGDRNERGGSADSSPERPASARKSDKSNRAERDSDEDKHDALATAAARGVAPVNQSGGSESPNSVEQEAAIAGTPTAAIVKPTNAVTETSTVTDESSISNAAPLGNPSQSTDSMDQDGAFASNLAIDEKIANADNTVAQPMMEEPSLELSTYQVPSTEIAPLSNAGALSAGATAGQATPTGETIAATDMDSKSELEQASHQIVESAGTEEERSRDADSRNQFGDSAETAIQSVNTIAQTSSAVENKTAAQDAASIAAPIAANAAADSGSASKTTKERGVSNDDRIDGLLTSLNRLQRNGTTARGSQAGEAQDMPRVDAARFVDRVSKAFQSAHERGGTLTLRLNPAELGSLRLELTVKDGAMSAAVETESNMTRTVLLEHLPALRERLAEQNIRIERFDVDVRRDGSGGQSNAGMHGESQSESYNQHHRGQMRAANNSQQVIKNVVTPTHVIGSAELNLVV